MKSLFKNFMKQDPIEAALTKLSIFSDTSSTLNLPELLKYYQKQQAEHKEDSLIDILITQIQKKKLMTTKLKILMYLFSISKLSTYDIIDLITRKKLKAFSENNKKSVNVSLFELSLTNKDSYIHKHLFLAIYNYMIKLSTNQQLYKICDSGEIPYDQVFRKGNKIRYIWVFKIFNLINLLLPILSPILIILDKFPKEVLFVQILEIIKKDIVIYVNFITKCIQQTSFVNPFLLPYNDCLQYYESVKQYKMLKTKNLKLLHEVDSYVPEFQIKFTQIDETSFVELQMLAVRIQLISTSLRSTTNKQNQRMVTEYNDKVQKYETRLKTLES